MDSVQINTLKLHISHAAGILAENPVAGVKEREAEQILFLGSCHDSIPRLLIQDRTLNATEKLAWQHIRISVTDPHRPSVMPKITELMGLLDCSKPTAIRAVQVLRMMRWVTLCQEVRTAKGRNCGRIFALHDEPLSLADTLTLDGDYLEFINDLALSSNSRLQILSVGVLEHIDTQIEDNDFNVLIGRTQLEQAAARIEATQNPDSNHYFFAVSPETSNKVKNIDSDIGSKSNRVKIIDPVNRGESDRVKIIDSDHSSSSNKTTTTSVVLTYPKQFNHHERKLGRRVVSKISCIEDQQYILNYMADRLVAAEKGRSKAIHDRLAYLGTIVKKFLDGELEPSSYGIREEKNEDKGTASNAVDLKDKKETELAKQKAARAKLLEEHGPKPFSSILAGMKKQSVI